MNNQKLAERMRVKIMKYIELHDLEPKRKLKYPKMTHGKWECSSCGVVKYFIFERCGDCEAGKGVKVKG